MNRQVLKRFWNQRSAFSLIEVVLAVAVIAIGLMAVIGLFPQGLQSSRETADNTVVATFVQDIFGTIRTQPFTKVNLTGSLPDRDLSKNVPPPSRMCSGMTRMDTTLLHPRTGISKSISLSRRE